LATVEQCEQALHDLAARLAERDPSDKRKSLDRSLTCDVRDLGVVFAGQLREGRIENVRQVDSVQSVGAQVKLAMKGDDLVKLVAGELNMAAAWATGRVKVDASMRDIIKLRSIF
jgi:SCP-2 sterol transfer family protein